MRGAAFLAELRPSSKELVWPWSAYGETLSGLVAFVGACVQGRCPWLLWFSLSGWSVLPAFFQYECYFRTIIYLVASHLPFNLPNPFPVTHPNSHWGKKRDVARRPSQRQSRAPRPDPARAQGWKRYEATLL